MSRNSIAWTIGESTTRLRTCLMVEPDGLDSDADLQSWIAQAQEFVETLPPK